MKRMASVQQFLFFLVLVLFLLATGFLAVSHLFETSHLYAGATPESITMQYDAFLPNLTLTACLIILMLGIFRILRYRRSKIVLMLLGAAGATLSIVFLTGANTTQIYDFYYVIEAAELFAKGNYKSLGVDYFHVYSYQLGFCLPLEILLRIFPSLDINRFMQAANVVLNVASAGVMAVLCAELTGDRCLGKMTMAMSLLFLPLFLFPVYVYGTIPMVFFSLCAMLCFTHYFKTRRVLFGLLWPVLMAAAYVLKPNAAIPMIAIAICAVLDVMESRDWNLLLFVALSVVLSVVAIKLIILQYEIRGDMELTEDLSHLARLVMGFKDDGGAAGWYNGYTDKFLPLDVTSQMEREMAIADLDAVMAAFAANPGSLLVFLREKLLTQWLEPTNGCLWYGNLNDQHGVLKDLATLVYEQGSSLRVALEGYMNIFQQALYLLSTVGAIKLIHQKKGSIHLILPLVLLGGVMYHLIFEAKSSYSYMYVLLLMPIATQGLGELDEWLGALCRRAKNN